MDTGVLTCAGCGAWYPIIACVPEILSDHLRDPARDRQWLASVAAKLPPALVSLWNAFEFGTAADAGAHHKLAEIALPGKITDDGSGDPATRRPSICGRPNTPGTSSGTSSWPNRCSNSREATSCSTSARVLVDHGVVPAERLRADRHGHLPRLSGDCHPAHRVESAAPARRRRGVPADSERQCPGGARLRGVSSHPESAGRDA